MSPSTLKDFRERRDLLRKYADNLTIIVHRAAIYQGIPDFQSDFGNLNSELQLNELDADFMQKFDQDSGARDDDITQALHALYSNTYDRLMTPLAGVVGISCPEYCLRTTAIALDQQMGKLNKIVNVSLARFDAYAAKN